MKQGEWCLHYVVKEGDRSSGICARIVTSGEYPLFVDNIDRPGSDLNLIRPGETLYITSHNIKRDTAPIWYKLMAKDRRGLIFKSRRSQRQAPFGGRRIGKLDRRRR